MVTTNCTKLFVYHRRSYSRGSLQSAARCPLPNATQCAHAQVCSNYALDAAAIFPKCSEISIRIDRSERIKWGARNDLLAAAASDALTVRLPGHSVCILQSL